MYQGSILLKYISKKEYVDDFMAGKLYMNSLYYFWNEYPLEKAKQEKEKIIKETGANPDDVLVPIEGGLNNQQADIYEGTIAFGKDEDFESSEFKGHVLMDSAYRAVGYGYCDVLCFYRLDYSIIDRLISYSVGNMSGFGEYVVIVDNQSELIRRINKASEALGFKYLCGNVTYRRPKLNGVPIEINRPHIALKSELAIDISSKMTGSSIISTRDAFMKMDKYKDQNEWRVALYRGAKETEAYQLDIGDIRDIAHWVKAENMMTEVDRLIGKGARAFCNGFYGNISRKEMKEKFYLLGDNYAHVISIIG